VTSGVGPDEDGEVDGAADELEDGGADDVDGKSVAELGADEELAPGLPNPVVVLLQAVTATSRRAARRAVRRRGRCGMARG